MEWNYNKAVHWLMERSIPEHQIRDGSVPEKSLDWLLKLIGNWPARVLHIGNFVGMSLGHLLHGLPSASVVVSVDPNIPHREVKNPQSIVIELLRHFHLDNGRVPHCLVCGYSMQVLPALEFLGTRFDAVLIDGDHEPDYLRKELNAAYNLLRSDGLMALDDVDHHWPMVSCVFNEAAADGRFCKPLLDGRMGAMRKI